MYRLSPLFFTTVMILLFNNICKAQLTDGSTVENFTLTDINNNSHTLYSYLDEGKYVLIDVSAVWCITCWSFHENHVFDEVYQNYGPEGTNEIMPFFIEGDVNTTEENLNGFGYTQGDWVSDAAYPFFDGEEAANVAIQTLGISGFPTIYMICPNRKIFNVGKIYSAQGYYDKIQDLEGCQATTSYNNLSDSNISITPNPSQGFINISIEGQSIQDVNLNVYTLTGKLVKSKYFDNISNNIQIDLSDLTMGSYLIQVINKKGAFSEKIILNQ